MQVWSAILVIYSGLLGAAGVAASAAAAHASNDPRLATAATFAILHATAILAAALTIRSGRLLAGRLVMVAATVLAAGSALFCGDLAMRVFAGTGLFPMAAPAGGFLLIAGWLALAASGVAGLFGQSQADSR